MCTSSIVAAIQALPLYTQTNVADIKRRKGVTTSPLQLREGSSEEVLLTENISPAAPCCKLYKGVIRLWILLKYSNTLIKDIMKRSVPPLPSLRDDDSTLGEITSVVDSIRVSEEETRR